MTPESAEEYLKRSPEFKWLTDADQDHWFTVNEVAERLRIGESFVRNAANRREIDGAINYGPGLGWRLPRRGLMIFFAQLKQQGRKVG
jgi:Mn-dependent DtxR family transcriptional regulator